MDMITILADKRDGRALSAAQLDYFITEYTAGNIPDYQASALLMAIYVNGMTRREIVDLTLAMAWSGDTLDLSDIAPFVVDKHSSGGVGDKTTLVVAPVVAACGVPVGKMSGRGLGNSGGTLDKMEAIPGWQCDLTVAQFRRQLRDIGFVLAGQSADLAPADGKLYALRDVTATVGSVPLIAGSIMSKKLASGANGIVLDVKVGSGAFMTSVAEAEKLAQIMVNIGNDAGRKTAAILTNMNQPLGYAIGNALEVKEAMAMLNGATNPADFYAHCVEIAAWMLLLAGKAATLDAAKKLTMQTLASGAAYTKWREMVVAQGGDGAYVDDPNRMAAAPFTQPLLAPQAGWIDRIDTGAIGWAAVELGGGRKVKTDKIDPAVGFVFRAKVGDYLEAGESMGMVHAADKAAAQQAYDSVQSAVSWSAERVAPLTHILGIVQ